MARKTKPKGFWKSIDNCLNEAKKLIKEHNLSVLPSADEFSKFNYPGLSTAISKYHGGFTNVRELLGEKELTKPNGYWTLEKTISEVKRLMKENKLERVPTAKKIRDLGYSDLITAIYKNHDGLNNLKEKYFREKPMSRPEGYWTLENTISEAKKVMKEHNFDAFPSGNKLIELDYGALNSAICRYHGGFTKFRGLLGEGLLEKPKKYWLNLDNCLDEAKKIMKEQEVDRLPPGDELHELGYGSLSNAISTNHGGFNSFRRLLGQKELQRDLGFWQSLENTINEANKIMKEQNYDALPSQKELQKRGYGSFCVATNYHGGLNKIRKILGQKELIKPMGYWQSLENTIYEAKKVMEKHGFDRFPSETKLKNVGQKTLCGYISKYHGGMINFREIMNQELGIKSNKEHLTEVWKKYISE